MRAERDDVRLTPERRNYTMLIIGGTVLLLAVLLYIGRRDTDELIEETPTVVRDSAIVAPPVVDTPPVQQQTANSDAAADAPRRDFTERALPPPVDTVGAGVVATGTERTTSESLVIDGDLLQELEEDAQIRAGEASPDQLRTPQ